MRSPVLSPAADRCRRKRLAKLKYNIEQEFQNDGSSVNENPSYGNGFHENLRNGSSVNENPYDGSRVNENPSDRSSFNENLRETVGLIEECKTLGVETHVMEHICNSETLDSLMSKGNIDRDDCFEMCNLNKPSQSKCENVYSLTEHCDTTEQVSSLTDEQNQTAGDIVCTASNMVHTAGGMEHNAGDTENNAGDMGHTSSDTGHTFGDMGHTDVDTGHTSSDTRHIYSDMGHTASSDTGHTFSDLGHTCGDTGHTAGDTGHTAGDTGHTAGDTGHTAGDTGHTAGDTGHTAGDTGHTAGDTGHTCGDTGHTAGDTGHTSSDTGHTAGDTGHTSSDTGHTAGDTGHTCGDTGHTAGDTGHTSSDTGHTASDTRHSSSHTRHTFRDMGHSGVDTGHTAGDREHTARDKGHSSGYTGHTAGDKGHTSGDTVHTASDMGQTAGGIGHTASDTGHTFVDMGHIVDDTGNTTSTQQGREQQPLNTPYDNCTTEIGRSQDSKSVGSACFGDISKQLGMANSYTNTTICEQSFAVPVATGSVSFSVSDRNLTVAEDSVLESLVNENTNTNVPCTDDVSSCSMKYMSNSSSSDNLIVYESVLTQVIPTPSEQVNYISESEASQHIIIEIHETDNQLETDANNNCLLNVEENGSSSPVIDDCALIQNVLALCSTKVNSFEDTKVNYLETCESAQVNSEQPCENAHASYLEGSGFQGAGFYKPIEEFEETINIDMEVTAPDVLKSLEGKTFNEMSMTTTSDCTLNSHKYTVNNIQDKQNADKKLKHKKKKTENALSQLENTEACGGFSEHFASLHTVNSDIEKTVCLTADTVSAENETSGKSKPVRKKYRRGKSKAKLQRLCVKIEDDKRIRRFMLQDMQEGNYGKAPHVIRVSKHGTLADVTDQYKEYLPCDAGDETSQVSDIQVSCESVS